MFPIRGRNDRNLVPCKTVESPNAQPAKKDAPANPSLLKALEAVVAAGRQGLLGPEAAAAVATVPSLNAGGANPPGALNPIPPLPATEKKKKKKKKKKKQQQQQKQLPNEGRQALITVVPTPGQGAENPKPVANEVWICGNSVIMASGKRALTQTQGMQLGIPPSKAYVYWRWVQEMRWEQLLPLLHEIYHLRSPPSIIIIHVGEDDLLPGNNTSFLTAMKNDLGIIKRAFPSASIIWSSLLPRRVWRGNQKPEEMEKLQKHINIKMVSHCKEVGVQFLPHTSITSDKTDLFSPSFKELSDAGADLFISDLKGILRSYRLYV